MKTAPLECGIDAILIRKLHLEDVQMKRPQTWNHMTVPRDSVEELSNEANGDSCDCNMNQNRSFATS